jgi:hypothetical protein
MVGVVIEGTVAVGTCRMCTGCGSLYKALGRPWRLIVSIQRTFDQDCKNCLTMKISTVLSVLLLLGAAVRGYAKPRGKSAEGTEKVPANPGRMGDRVEEEETVPAPPQLPTTSVGVPAVASLPTALHVSSDDEESSSDAEDESEDEVEVLPKRRDGPFARNPGHGFDMSPMVEMDVTPMSDATAADLSRFRFKYWMDRFFVMVMVLSPVHD